MKTYGSVTYEGQTYKTVVIGTQTWMAENLNYNVANSRCNGDNTGGDSQGNCAKFGRLYDWATAMNLPASCNSSSCATSISAKHQGICPQGWHLPSTADWNVLMKFVNPSCSDNSSCDGAGTKLRATSGWNTCSSCKTGTDDYGFSALPGGFGFSFGYFSLVGGGGIWWSASEDDSDYADYSYNGGDVEWPTSRKGNLFSVRCLQD